MQGSSIRPHKAVDQLNTQDTANTVFVYNAVITFWKLLFCNNFQAVTNPGSLQSESKRGSKNVKELRGPGLIDFNVFSEHCVRGLQFLRQPSISWLCKESTESTGLVGEGPGEDPECSYYCSSRSQIFRPNIFYFLLVYAQK